MRKQAEINSEGLINADCSGTRTSSLRTQEGAPAARGPRRRLHRAAEAGGAARGLGGAVPRAALHPRDGGLLGGRAAASASPASTGIEISAIGLSYGPPGGQTKFRKKKTYI